MTTPESRSASSLIYYQTADGQTRVQCRFEEETIWLKQAQMADLFQTTPQNITPQLKAVFSEGELNEMATCKDCLQVRKEGGREVSRSLRYLRHSRAGGNPAKQTYCVADKTVVPPCGDYAINWIPACAGMTAEVRA